MVGKGPGSRVIGSGDINPPRVSMDGGRSKIGSGKEGAVLSEVRTLPQVHF
jgi:hypothetical protein